ncbi:iron complex outermembrane receptor protein [Pseudomonas lurida]|nr:iron complex outermembrane receptor protein [Pseudomonas lurida]
MTVRFLRNSPDSSYPLLSKAVRAALLSTAMGIGVVPITGMAAQDGTEQIHQRFDLPAGALSDVLNQFARQAGITLSSTPAQTQGRASPGLQGDYSAEQGLNHLLGGSGLQAVSADGVSFVLQALPDRSALTLPTTDIKGFALGNALGSMEGYNATHSQIATKTSTALLETSQTVSVMRHNIRQMDYNPRIPRLAEVFDERYQGTSESFQRRIQDRRADPRL